MPADLLEIKHTLIRARQLRNMLTKLEATFPHLAEMAVNIEPCDHVVARDRPLHQRARRRAGRRQPTRWGASAANCAWRRIAC
jgi:hypothetical protein